MVAAGAAAKARIPALVVPSPNVYMRVPPGLLEEVRGHSCIFHGWLPATLKDPADSEAVRFALVLPESKPFYSFGGENIHEPSRR